ncbi:hypothetical protein [Acinetobacter sp.]|jgi:hypothetical protein|uniref:hypothetical protein n=1 Tax=Acinetobacter sp. TaxID=472 RepID=UPI0035B2ED87
MVCADLCGKEAARYFTKHIRANTAGVNIPLPGSVAYHSLGSWKRPLFDDLYVLWLMACMRFYTPQNNDPALSFCAQVS